VLEIRHPRIAGVFRGDPEAGGSDGFLLALSPSHGLFDIVRDYECGRDYCALVHANSGLPEFGRLKSAEIG